MIERNLLDQTKDLRPPQRMVQSNFGMLTEEQRRIAEQGLSQNERVGRDRMASLQIYRTQLAACQDKTMRLNAFSG
jgi:hypothetical protein